LDKNKEGFLKLYNNYTNKSLEEFVKNSNDTKRIIEFKGKLIQKMDPIFKEPKSNFIKAHFYASEKKFFGQPVDTFIINVIVLWVMTIALYLVLYFRLLKRLLESGETIMGKKPKGIE
jgi:hypothetical protein